MTLCITVCRYYIFVYFDISVVDSNGHVTITKLFAKAPIGELSIARACESFQASLTLLETTEIKLGIGLVGNEADWQSSMHTFDDIPQTQGTEMLDTTESVQSLSLQSGLITFVVKGNPAIFSSPLASSYYIDIEHLTTLHFLDPVKYATIKAMIDLGEGYSIVENPANNNRLEVKLSQDVIDTCTGGNGGVFSCAVRHDVKGTQINTDYAIHSFATGIGTTNVDLSRDWITTNLLGVSEFSKELATNMTSLVRNKFDINDRSNKAWYINPGYLWTSVQGSAAQNILHLSDKLIAVAIITLNDGGGNLVRRRLVTTTLSGGISESRKIFRRASEKYPPSLSMGKTQIRGQRRVSIPSTQDEKFKDAMDTISTNPRAGALPPIDYSVNVGREIASILGIDKDNMWGMVDMHMKGVFPATTTTRELHDYVSSRLKRNVARYCKTCKDVYPVFYNLDDYGQITASASGSPTSSMVSVPSSYATNRRMLLLEALRSDGSDSSSSVDAKSYEGTISVMMSYEQAHNEIIFSELFRSMLEGSYLTSGSGTAEGSSVDDYFASIQNNQLVISAVNPTWDMYNTTKIVMDMKISSSAFSGIYNHEGDNSGSWSSDNVGFPILILFRIAVYVSCVHVDLF